MRIKLKYQCFKFSKNLVVELLALFILPSLLKMVIFLNIYYGNFFKYLLFEVNFMQSSHYQKDNLQ